ncbi:MAG: J domain-containing protein [Porphyrobacter sp.]|nr:J domain-containing protein [Porphyrobacter sp.]
MGKLLVYAVLAVIVWRMASGRWPWEPKDSARQQAMVRARKLLGVRAHANHAEIIEAHRRLLAMVHPDRGGTNEQVHEANAARDLLLDALPDR